MVRRRPCAVSNHEAPAGSSFETRRRRRSSEPVKKYCPHPEELAKQASRRMDTMQGLAAILRDARKDALLRMRSGIYFTTSQDEVLDRNMRRSKAAEGAFLYILRCSDGSFYIGTTRTALEIRIAQHNAGTFGGYTATRRPVTLVFSQWFDRITDAIESERKLKKWSRAKKEAFIRGDYAALQRLSAPRSPHPSRRPLQ
jgi:putative endonuclease